MDRYQDLFAKLADKNQGAFVPFVTDRKSTRLNSSH